MTLIQGVSLILRDSEVMCSCIIIIIIMIMMMMIIIIIIIIVIVLVKIKIMRSILTQGQKSLTKFLWDSWS